MAGMIDADGHIGWRGGKYMAPDVGVTTTSLELINWMSSEIGGCFSLERRACNQSCIENHIHRRTDIYRWHLTGQRAVIFLEAIEPYLIIKRQSALNKIKMYTESLQEMKRPARRLHHIIKENAAMSILGWS